MRRNFAQVMREGKVDIKKEYAKLFSLFYDKDKKDGSSIADIVSNNFTSFYFRGTCLTLDEFDEMHNIHFVRQPQDFDVDYLVSFCEYIYNFVVHLSDRFFFCLFDKSAYIDHIYRVIDAIGYEQSKEDGFTIFVPKDNVAFAVAESSLMPAPLSYKVIAYNHHSKKGDLENKRQILLALADVLEPQRKTLESIDRQFTSDLFYAYNNFNIRHNNIDPTGPKYKKPISDLTEEQLEYWYDEVYQMSLMAFMRLEHGIRKKDFDVLKSQIEGT